MVVLVLASGGRGTKQKETRKRPVPVTDPMSLRSLQDWVDLGKEALALSCSAVNISPVGATETLARRLFDFYSSLPPANNGASLSPVRASPLVNSLAGNLQSSPPAWGSSGFFAQDPRNVDLTTPSSVRMTSTSRTSRDGAGSSNSGPDHLATQSSAKRFKKNLSLRGGVGGTSSAAFSSFSTTDGDSVTSNSRESGLAGLVREANSLAANAPRIVPRSANSARSSSTTVSSRPSFVDASRPTMPEAVRGELVELVRETVREALRANGLSGGGMLAGEREQQVGAGPGSQVGASDASGQQTLPPWLSGVGVGQVGRLGSGQQVQGGQASVGSAQVGCGLSAGVVGGLHSSSGHSFGIQARGWRCRRSSSTWCWSSGRPGSWCSGC